MLSLKSTIIDTFIIKKLSANQLMSFGLKAGQVKKELSRVEICVENFIPPANGAHLLCTLSNVI